MTVPINLLDSSHQLIIELDLRQDPSTKLPEELITFIFSFFTTNELLSCTLVSKTWKRLAEDNIHWNIRALLLDIPYEEQHKKQVISKRVVQLTSDIQKAGPYLERPVKTGYELDEMIRPLFYKLRKFTAEEEKDLEERYNQCLNEKHAYFEIIKRGFNAHQLLNRIGRGAPGKI